MHFIRSRYGYLTGILGLLTLLGCGSSSKHSADAYLNWNIYDLSDTTMANFLSCADVGAASVVVTLDGLPPYKFACADNNDYILGVPSGTYSITVELYADANATILLDHIPTYTQTLLSGTNNIGPVNFLVNSFVLGWSISYNGVSTTCAAVGAAWVALDIYYSGEAQPTSYYLACDSAEYRAATAAIEMQQNPYTVTWKAFLLDANDIELLPGTQLMSYNVYSSTQADLGTVYFAF
jgi:hypothetical protein